MKALILSVDHDKKRVSLSMKPEHFDDSELDGEESDAGEDEAGGGLWSLILLLFAHPLNSH